MNLEHVTSMWHASHMSSMIQIRNVPESIHRALKARAKKEGTTLSEFLLRHAKAVLAYPSWTEIAEQLRKRGPVQADLDGVKEIRALRNTRR